MPLSLIRWALPHKGSPAHLSTPEYTLRLIVFTPLWLVTFLPVLALLVFCASNGALAIAFVLGFGGVVNGRGLHFTTAEKAELLLFGVSWAAMFALNLFVRYRYLTPR